MSKTALLPATLDFISAGMPYSPLVSLSPQLLRGDAINHHYMDPVKTMGDCLMVKEMAFSQTANWSVSVRRQPKPSAPFGCFRTALCAALVLLSLCSIVSAGPQWEECEGFSKEYQCSSFALPLDYRNESDGRTINIALTRLLASDQKKRKGAVFVNPGGPGNSGTNMVKIAGAGMDIILKGQYDIIGFDPRGIKNSMPYVSCFETALEEEAFRSLITPDILNLPANVSILEHADLSRQVELQLALATSLAKQCLARSGEILPYLGTENVVNDIDYLSRAIEGDDAPINYWGISYGTIIGQYMVKILAPERIGRIVLDAVINPVQWAQNSLHFFDNALQDIDKVLYFFASFCMEAGPNCTLNVGSKFDSASALLKQIDSTVDALYVHPAPVYGLEVPGIVTARNLRLLLFSSMYKIASWPALSNILLQAFEGELADVMQLTTVPVQGESANKSDSSGLATHAIVCADVAPYTDSNPAPTTAEVVTSVIDKLKVSPRAGEAEWGILCHKWTEAGAPPSKSRYSGNFSLEDDTLKTPLLILTNTYDPVAPLANAILTNTRLGNNARLIQQSGGLGHSTVSHVSYCTVRAMQEYMLDSKLPEQKHSRCNVDQRPFVPFEQTLASFGQNEADLLKAWLKVSDSF